MQANQIWQAVLSELRGTLSPNEFETMLKTSTVAAFANGQAVVAMPNAYAAEWSETRLTPAIERIMGRIVGYPVSVRFGVREGDSYYIPAPGTGRTIAPPAEAESPTNGHSTVNGSSGPWAGLSTASPGYGLPSVIPSIKEGRNGTGAGRREGGTRNSAPAGEQQYAEDYSPLNPRYIFENFIVGSGNRLAHAASLAVADAPGHAYNPLFIYGGVGLGKTHLLHAIGHQAMERLGNLRVLYVSSEKFTNDLINAIREHTNEDFRNRYRRIDILLIDDIQFIAGKESTQEEFFHTFNALHGAGKQIVISSDRPPRAILTLEDRLRSRFEGGLIADIQPPDLETRIAILRVKGESQQIPVPTEVTDYVARQVVSNIRELEGALNRVIAYALLNQKPLTVDVAAQALSDLSLNNRRRTITPARIVETVAGFYNMEVEDLKAKSRTREVVLPRQVAMFIIREETDSSLTDIGAEFGNRDHTTVMHACSKIERDMDKDNQLRQAVLTIRQMLHGEIVH
jgi:chromosomal replication initiator protein